MQQKEHTQQFIRQRRLLTVLPLLILPFMTFMFWALGGGKTDHANAQNVQKGFNMQLPGAHLKDDKPQDKLSYYQQASADSLKLQQQIKNDPYYHMQAGADTQPRILADTGTISPGDSIPASKRISRTPHYSDPNETKVYRKLAQLNAAINRPAPAAEHSADENVGSSSNPPVANNDVDRLEHMMKTMEQPGSPDPEMQQLNGMLGKILDIQHPDLVKERLRQQSEAKRGMVLPVLAAGQNDPVSLISNQYSGTTDGSDTLPAIPIRHNGFYSIDDGQGNETQNAIEAVVHETQTLVNGSTVKLRLLNDVYISGVLIPRNTFVFGAAQLNGERLTIKIPSVRYHNSLFPVELSVYDMDGMAGICIPGAITRDVAKESADRSMQEVSFSTMDPSIGAQAASAGITAAKTLFSKKVKLIKVTLKAGYHVLLRDEKQKHNN